jgi:hypothetical protein
MAPAKAPGGPAEQYAERAGDDSDQGADRATDRNAAAQCRRVAVGDADLTLGGALCHSNADDPGLALHLAQRPEGLAVIGEVHDENVLSSGTGRWRCAFPRT